MVMFKKLLFFFYNCYFLFLSKTMPIDGLNRDYDYTFSERRVDSDKIIEIRGGEILPPVDGFTPDPSCTSLHIRRKVRSKLDNPKPKGNRSAPRPVVVLGNPPRIIVANGQSYTPTGDEYQNAPQNQASNKKTDTTDTLKSYSEIMQELDKQRDKKIVRISLKEKIYAIKNQNHDYVEDLAGKLADQLYNEIRESNFDVSDISRNTGFKADNIKNVKDHVFYNEHVLDRYGPDQIEHKRFDADLKQALAWKRLETGTHTQDDVTWIKHECAERHHELKYGSGYNEAHNRAQTRFDGAPWENQF